MAFVALCLFVAVLAGMAWLIRRQVRGPGTKLVGPRDAALEFHAVAILTGDNTCAAVQRIFGRRYLSDSAPRFPLPGCDTVDCACRYEHHADRRTAGERRDIWVASGSVQAFVEPNLTPRHRKDRRSG